MTQVAEVAVKNVSRKEVTCPFLAANGSISNNAPVRIMPQYPKKMIFIGEIWDNSRLCTVFKEFAPFYKVYMPLYNNKYLYKCMNKL